MQNHYPLWKNLLILLVLAISVIYSLPNIYSNDPSVQIAPAVKGQIEPAKIDLIKTTLAKANLVAKDFEVADNQVLIRFANTDVQLKAASLLRDAMGDNISVALNLASSTPKWLRNLGANPMYLGLDLRGGVHFLLEVDMAAALKQAEERYTLDIRSLLRNEKVRYESVSKEAGAIKVTLKDAQEKSKALTVLDRDFHNLDMKDSPTNPAEILVRISEKEKHDLEKNAVDQNITTLHNRVNEIGVAEPVIQRQGDNRIVVQLPGIQDTNRAKEILGKTATLEYRLVDTEHDVQKAVQEGDVPVGSRVYYEVNGNPVLLDRHVIVTGAEIVDAAYVPDQDGQPAVSITLNGLGAKKMGKMTQKNIGKPMAVVFIEYKTENKMVDGKKVHKREKVEKVISIATIRDSFSKRFQTTGLDSPEEARNLSLLLRAGALAAPVEIVEERTVGPSLGQANIDAGMLSFKVGFGAVVLLIAVFYKLSGVIANVALTFNVFIVVAILSLLQATLTLPGIAGIILTVGMSVDANVLIFERIKEELKNGNPVQSSIFIGYDKAFATILDSHFTNLVVAVVLFAFGTGTVKGFAVTLIIGILSSMFTAITVTRMISNWIHGGRELEKLSI
jgi:preprotein translocase subunit SecD